MASTSPEGKQLYNQWIIQDNRNIIHVLEDMPSVKPEIDHLCELLPRLQCRYYSISSSAKVCLIRDPPQFSAHLNVFYLPIIIDFISPSRQPIDVVLGEDRNMSTSDLDSWKVQNFATVY